jgi:hypothetical protein
VAATIVAVLDADTTIGKGFDLFSGGQPIDEALRGL